MKDVRITCDDFYVPTFPIGGRSLDQFAKWQAYRVNGGAWRWRKTWDIPLEVFRWGSK